MAEPFLGEIKLVPYNFAPRGWAFCAGQVLPISQNTALFSLLGTLYGGNGQTTFQLPDLQGRVILHRGQGSGLSNYNQGDKGGVEGVTLTVGQIPAHSHSINAHSGIGTESSPVAHFLSSSSLALGFTYGASSNESMVNEIALTGGNQPHDNRQPFLVLNYIIALQGIFPSRP